MKITVTTSSDLIFVLDVAEDLELENFKAFCEVESGIPSSQIGVAYNGQLLVDDKKPLKAYGINDGDVVIIDRVAQGSGSGGGKMQFANESIFEIPIIRHKGSRALLWRDDDGGSVNVFVNCLLFLLSCCLCGPPPLTSICIRNILLRLQCPHHHTHKNILPQQLTHPHNHRLI